MQKTFNYERVDGALFYFMKFTLKNNIQILIY